MAAVSVPPIDGPAPDGRKGRSGADAMDPTHAYGDLVDARRYCRNPP